MRAGNGARVDFLALAVGAPTSRRLSPNMTHCCTTRRSASVRSLLAVVSALQNPLGTVREKFVGQLKQPRDPPVR